MKDLIDIYRKRFSDFIEAIWTLDKFPPYPEKPAAKALDKRLDSSISDIVDQCIDPREKQEHFVTFLKSAFEKLESKELVQYFPNETAKILSRHKQLKKILSKM